MSLVTCDLACNKTHSVLLAERLRSKHFILLYAHCYTTTRCWQWLPPRPLSHFTDFLPLISVGCAIFHLSTYLAVFIISSFLLALLLAFAFAFKVRQCRYITEQQCGGVRAFYLGHAWSGFSESTCILVIGLNSCSRDIEFCFYFSKKYDALFFIIGSRLKRKLNFPDYYYYYCYLSSRYGLYHILACIYVLMNHVAGRGKATSAAEFVEIDFCTVSFIPSWLFRTVIL